MIRCTKCQTINADDAIFCTNCASFLEWTGERIEPAPEPPTLPPPEPPEPEPPEPRPEPAAPTPAATAQQTASLGTAPASPEAPEQETPEPAAVEPAPPSPEPDRPAEPPPAAERETTPEAEAPPEAEVTAEAAVTAAPGAPPEPDVTEPEATQQEPAHEVEPPAVVGPDIASAPPPEPETKPAPEPERPIVPPPTQPRPPFVVPPLVGEPPRPAAAPPEPSKPSYRFRAPPTPPRPTTQSIPPPIRQRPPAQPGPVRPVLPPTPPLRPAPTQPEARRPTPITEQPLHRRPQVVPEQQPRRRPTTPQHLTTEPQVKPGDLICAVCSTGNNPDRRFCRRCGNSLATAVVAVKPPWYRRLFGRNRRAIAAGQRPGYMGRTGRTRGSVIKTIVVVVLLLAVIAPVIGYVAVPAFRERVDLLIADLTLDFTLSQHPTQNALDLDATSFWLADPSRGVPTLTVSFEKTEDLAGVLFHSGAGTGTDYRTYARPRLVELRFGGESQPVSYELKDTPVPQTECLDAIHSVLSLEIRVLSVYPAEPTGQELVAVRRVEFRSENCP